MEKFPVLFALFHFAFVFQYLSVCAFSLQAKSRKLNCKFCANLLKNLTRVIFLVL